MDGTERIRRWTIFAVLVLIVSGCGEPDAGVGSDMFTGDVDMGTTIGALADVSVPPSVPLRGYGLVGDLQGTGSSECPSALRAYLRRYILMQLPQHNIDVGQLISSRNTAVVAVEGETPRLGLKNERFDILVTALEGTQTTSLEGGWLYGAEMKPAARFVVGAPPVAKAGGPIFMDKLGGRVREPRTAYVMAGGKVLENYIITLTLRRRDYEMTSVIRNRLNMRFGSGTATAQQAGRIGVTVPVAYRSRKDDFVVMVKALYIETGTEQVTARIRHHVHQLAVDASKYDHEMALEAIGSQSLSKLKVLLNSSNVQTQFHAARCMLRLGSDEGFDVLRNMAFSVGSPLRVEALEAIASGAARNDAAAVARQLLRDPDFNIRIKAYEQLRNLDDVSIVRQVIGDSFHLDRIAYGDRQGVFVSRSGQPRVVLFGSPIYCAENVFVQSADGTIVIDAPRGQRHVSVIRRNPSRSSEFIKLRSSFKLGDIVRVLGEARAKAGDAAPGGLGVPYAEIIALLQQMVDRGAVRAEFRAGPLPEFGPNIKK